MDKFSVYDFLGMILPGIVFLFFLNVINNIYCFFSSSLFIEDGVNELKELSMLLCFAIIAGSILYSINFYLANRVSLYNKVFGMYKPVAEIYLNMTYLHAIMNSTFNKKAIEKFEKSIFFSKLEFENMDSLQKLENFEKQDEFYDIIYYELEYFGKINSPKDFQSFYFFFRQMVSAMLILIIIILFFLVFSFFKENYSEVLYPSFRLLGFLLFLVFICSKLAQWYRKRMVMKMYWAYYTLLNNQEKK